MMGVDFIKVHTAVPRDSYFAIARETARLHIPFVGHVPMAIEPTEAAEAGQHSVEHIATIFEGKYMTRFKTQEEGLQAMPQWIAQEGKKLAYIFAKHRTWFTPTVVGYEVRAHRGALAKTPDPRTRYTASRLRSFWDQVFPITERDRDANVIAGREKFVENGLELTRLMYQAKVGIVIGTDLGVRDVLPGFSVHDEIKLLAKIMPMTSIIQSATSKPSEMMGVADNVGTIAPDKLADMVILQRDPLENPNNVSSIDAVILRGQLLTRKRLDELLDRAATGTMPQLPR